MKKFLLALLILATGCASTPPPRSPACDRPHVEKTHYSTLQQVKAALEDQDREKTVYLIFSADWCRHCKRLKKLMGEANAMSNAMFLNADETWAFILSTQLGVEGVPAMMIFKGGQPEKLITDPNKIIMHFVIHH